MKPALNETAIERATRLCAEVDSICEKHWFARVLRKFTNWWYRPKSSKQTFIEGTVIEVIDSELAINGRYLLERVEGRGDHEVLWLRGPIAKFEMGEKSE
jgi:hypothetical protein